MTDLGKIDSRLAVPTTLGRDDLHMYDVTEAPFSLYGVTFSEGRFRRMPKAVASAVSEGVENLSENTAGGRVCFATDADVIALSCKRPSLWRMPHMTLLGSAGFELDIRDEEGKIVYYGSFIPTNESAGYASLVKFAEKKMREIVIHFPLYCPISEVLIGLPEGARLAKWNGYKHETPIVFYGSSITQGGCASTSGKDYASRISRRFDSNYLNLGFSGSAKGEDTMMDYLAGLSMSAFVYDYDYNAPTVEHLRETHYKGYRKIRDANLTLPIILASRPNFDCTYEKSNARRDVIRETYEKALAAGDGYIRFVDAEVHYPHFNAEDCTVDGTHPNDLGFYRMAKAIGDKLADFFEK